MKKNILLILIVSVSYIMQGQSYKPLLVEGNKWNIFYKFNSSMYKCGKSISTMDSTGTEVLSLSADTTINGMKYKNLLLANNYITGRFDTLGILREDTIAQRVYYWSKQYGFEDSLLYDFNVNIHDVVLNQTVDTIDSINIGASLHKRIRFYNGLDWIEGIGSTGGLISSIIEIPLCGNYYSRTLLCFYNKDLLVYKPENEETSDCFYETTYVGINTEGYSSNYSVFPNPATDNISIKSGNIQNYIVEIADIQGQILIKKNILNLNDQINLQGIKNGIYVVHIIDKNEVSLFKIIKK